MTRPRIRPLPVLAAGVLALAAGAAWADPAPARTGAYRIVSHGRHVIRARCAEGGNVVVPTREKTTAARRDRALRDACKNVDYSK